MIKLWDFKVEVGFGNLIGFRDFIEEDYKILWENLKENVNENEGKEGSQMGNLGQQKNIETLATLSL